jgi:hypothetical protein
MQKMNVSRRLMMEGQHWYQLLLTGLSMMEKQLMGVGLGRRRGGGEEMARLIGQTTTRNHLVIHFSTTPPRWALASPVAVLLLQRRQRSDLV